ncbi:MAG: glutamine synthetase type III, partial [Bacteroidales bacterium]|nr:glutamine synthetase type III [Bacteroidales bacterium]
MENIRFKALEATLNRKPQVFKLPSAKISDYFGEQTFCHISMQEFLPDDAYKQVLRAINKGEKIDRSMA